MAILNTGEPLLVSNNIPFPWGSKVSSKGELLFTPIIQHEQSILKDDLGNVSCVYSSIMFPTSKVSLCEVRNNTF